jgi:AbrB family looped-hinge helix DNA binding protein
MNATLTIDKAGRIVIPKTLRDELNLEPGDALALESDGDQVTLRPVRPASRLRKKRGIWVLSTGVKMTAADTDNVLQNIHEQRDRDNLGNFR